MWVVSRGAECDEKEDANDDFEFAIDIITVSYQDVMSITSSSSNKV